MHKYREGKSLKDLFHKGMLKSSNEHHRSKRKVRDELINNIMMMAKEKVGEAVMLNSL